MNSTLILSERFAVLEGLDDYSNELSDTLAPMLVAAFAAQEPAWLREARAAYYADDDFDWAYEDWKLERQWAQDAREYAGAMMAMDDDGGPAIDWLAVSWGLA